jgi:hypothetical protein
MEFLTLSRASNTALVIGTTDGALCLIAASA